MTKPGGYVNPNLARSEEYKKTLEKIKSEGHCPFCWENLGKEHKKPILKKTKFWLVTENQFSYQKARVKLLIIFKEHTNSIFDMPSEAWDELRQIYRWITFVFDINGSTLFNRQGDTRYTGGTVMHLHFHVISGHGESEESAVIARVG